MKKLQDNLAARIAASVILTVSFLLTLLSTAGIVLLASYQAYNDGGAQLRTSYLHAAGVQEYYDHVEPVLEGLVHEPQSYQNYLNSLNVHVDVKTTDGTTVFSNAKEGETSLLEGPFSYTFTTGETKLWKNTFSDAEKAQRALERFPYQIEDYEIEASPFEYSTSYSPIDESLGDALDETLSGLESYYPMLKIWYYPEGSLTEVEVGVTLAAAPIGNDSVATDHMFSPLRRQANYLNGIRDGMRNAVEERMQSERMKTELITNVSHDIKTPLTSIVNYAGLLQRDGLSSPDAPEYLEVLVRQSTRLKKLTEDLIEASKAATGNLTVHPEAVDAHVLLGQAEAEYADRLQNAKIEPVFDLRAQRFCVQADGRLLWRVFDNLLSNICKYGLPGSRAYLRTEERGELLRITFLNISRDALNIPAEELMERFVRGDASRSTEGSGLGLSIARSLTELQGGTFTIAIEGDLFKASVELPLTEE